MEKKAKITGLMDLLIIGGGPAGLSAAIKAKEEGLEDVLVIERSAILGGILNQCIHHGFGLHIFKEELTGPEYAWRLIKMAEELGVKFKLSSMVLNISNNREVTYVSQEGLETIHPRAVILAMGCRERPRGAIGIPGDRGIGIYTAGTAQALVNMKGIMPGQRVVILGSGDIGLIMARRMILEGAFVLGVYEIMPHSSGLSRNIVQCLDDYNIPLKLSHTVTRIIGKKRLEGVYVAPVDKNMSPIFSHEEYIPCDTLLLSVGLIPENELALQAGIILSPLTGGASVDSDLETNIPGIFSCGNVLHVHDLVDHVTMEAYDAAMGAIRFINGKEKKTYIDIETDKNIRYTVPSRLVWKESHTYTVSFRVNSIITPAIIKIIADDQEIKTIKKRIIIPSEMERVKFMLDRPAKKICIKKFYLP